MSRLTPVTWDEIQTGESPRSFARVPGWPPSRGRVGGPRSPASPGPLSVDGRTDSRSGPSNQAEGVRSQHAPRGPRQAWGWGPHARSAIRPGRCVLPARVSGAAEGTVLPLPHLMPG